MDLDSILVHKPAKKELGQYPAILTSHLVNNPHILLIFCVCVQAVDQLIAKDKELQAAIKQVQEQQARQQEIQTVKEEISKKDQEILNLESQLKEAEKLLVSLNNKVP